MRYLSAISAGGSPSAPGGPSPAGTVFEPVASPKAAKSRAAVYIDGFNLYHAVDALGQPWLKWLNLWALSESLINKRQETLEYVLWCTAEITSDAEKQKRHKEYQKALEEVGVSFAFGHFISDPVECRSCRDVYVKRTEKQGGDQERPDERT